MRKRRPAIATPVGVNLHQYVGNVPHYLYEADTRSTGVAGQHVAYLQYVSASQIIDNVNACAQVLRAPDHSIISVADIEGVCARAPNQNIVRAATVKNVVPGAAIQYYVCSGVSVQSVDTPLPIERISAILATKDVVAFATVNSIVAVVRVNDVSAVRTIDNVGLIGGGYVGEVRNVDRERLSVACPTKIDDLNYDVVRCIELEVDQIGASQRNDPRRYINLEAPARIVDQRVGKA